MNELKYNLEDKIYFILNKNINSGLISEITISKKEIYYEIEYYYESNLLTKHLDQSDIYKSIDDLIFALKSNYEARNGRINNTK